jgi:ATP-binding cassette subfamily D (ALD) long-chain fatty acid import protein
VVCTHRYTALVSELQDVLSDLGTGKYRRRMVKGDKALDDSLKPGLGTVISNSEDIVFERVPIVTPNGDLLAPNVSFRINQKQNLMIVGPNGYAPDHALHASVDALCCAVLCCAVRCLCCL